MIKRYPCQAAVLLVLGILTAKGLPPGRQQEILLAAPASAAAALLLASWALREKAALKKLRQAMLLGLVFAAGMARMHAAAREAQRQTDGLFDGQAVTVQGRVTDKKLKETSFGTLQWTVCLAVICILQAFYGFGVIFGNGDLSVNVRTSNPELYYWLEGLMRF